MKKELAKVDLHCVEQYRLLPNGTMKLVARVVIEDGDEADGLAQYLADVGPPEHIAHVWEL